MRPSTRRRLAGCGAGAFAVAVGVWVAPVDHAARGQQPVRPPAPAPPAPEPVSAVDAVERVRARGVAPIAVLRGPAELHAAPGGRVVAELRRRTEWNSTRVLAVVGARGQWLKVIATELPNGRRGWIRLEAARLRANPWAVRSDLSERTVTVRHRGRVVRRFPVAVGKPSTPTPVGTFAITDKLQITGGSPAYGCCAIALSGTQPHIEPGWRGGDRLAIHGTRLTWTIGEAESFGCLRARDKDAQWIVSRVYLGTLVEIRP
jgi:lipoprotein-anchoring transpeptidase ErfK/SrfK